MSTKRHFSFTTTSIPKKALPPEPDSKAKDIIVAQDAYAELLAAGPAQIVTCNTIPHETNTIDVQPAIAQAVQDLLRQWPTA